MAKILITGASGGLGTELYQYFGQHHELQGWSYSQEKPELLSIDIRNREAVIQAVATFKPEIIIHTVAITHVDSCDRDIEAAVAVNTLGTLNIRLAAENVSAKLVHISTNDIFSGKDGLYTEEQQPDPVNMYGKTKYMAEEMLYGYENSLILRFNIISWYASGKTSFAKWLVNSLKEGKAITLITDQFTSPIYTPTIAAYLETLIQQNATGIYHLGSERASRYESAFQLAQKMELNTSLISKGTMKDIDFFAPRPTDVSLNCDKLKQEFGLSTTLEQELGKMVSDFIKD